MSNGIVDQPGVDCVEDSSNGRSDQLDDVGLLLLGARWADYRDQNVLKITASEEQLLACLTSPNPKAKMSPGPLPHPTKRKIRPNSAAAKLQTHHSYYTPLVAVARPATASVVRTDKNSLPPRPVTQAGAFKNRWISASDTQATDVKQPRRLTLGTVEGLSENQVAESRPRPNVEPVSEQLKSKIEEKINIDTLEELKKAFAKADVDKSGKLDLDEFKLLLKSQLTLTNSKENQIDALFMKIDWSSEGGITWDEFCTYMQLEYAEKEDSYLRAKEVSFYLPAKVENIPHRDPVLRITDTSDGTFVACSQVSKSGTQSGWYGVILVWELGPEANKKCRGRFTVPPVTEAPRTTTERTTKGTPRTTRPTTTRRTPTTQRTTTTTTPRPTTTRRRITYRPLEGCSSRADIVFVIDSSGSIGYGDFSRVLHFLNRTTHGLDVDAGNFRIGAVRFSDDASVQFHLNQFDNKWDVENALLRIPYQYGSTNTAAALFLVRSSMFTQQNGDRPDIPNLVVVVTDGQSNVNNFETIPEALRLKRLGVSIITVAIGFDSVNAELVGITSQPIDDNLFRIDDFNSLDELHVKIVEPICTDANQCLAHPCENNALCVDGLRSYMCVCPPRFFGVHCEKSCARAADVAFVLDSSSNIGPETFSRMKSFIVDLVDEINMDTCGIRIGVMKYSSAPRMEFRLNAYSDTESVVRAIRNVHYARGEANMAAAIRSVREEMFSGNPGDRPDVRDIVYLFTDGSADILSHETMHQAELTINRGIRLIPIGVDIRDRYQVDSIASAQGLQAIDVNSADQFGSKIDEILRPLFDAEDHCRTDPCRNGATCKNLALGFQCTCAAGYSGVTCAKRCRAKADIAFIVDTSRYMTRLNLRRVKKYLRGVLRRLSFSARNFRVGVVGFGSGPRVTVNFAQGITKRAAYTGISLLRPTSGSPNPASGLSIANVNLFDKLHGDRANVPNHAVFITTSMRNAAVTFREAQLLKRKGVNLIGIGVGLSDNDKEYLEHIVSSKVSDHYLQVDDAASLDELTDQLVRGLCNEDDQCQPNPCQNEGVCTTGYRSYTCRCKHHYSGKNCERPCDNRADVTFLLDTSGSVGRKDFRKMIDYVGFVVEQFSIGPHQTQVGIVSFSSQSRLEFPLNAYDNKRDLKYAISSLPYIYGDTNTAAGLRTVRSSIFVASRGDRPGIKNFGIVITDGASNINHDDTIPEAEMLRETGAHIFAVGIGAVDQNEINAIANEPSSKNTFFLTNYDSLWNVSEDLVRTMCRQRSPCDSSPCQNGGKCVANINMYHCECTTAFTGPLCQINCASRKDIAFILDASTSVSIPNFEKMINFIYSVVQDMEVDGGHMRFALITYSTNVRLIFSFSRYTTKASLLDAIATTQYVSGSTNTAEALAAAEEMFSSEAYGDRPDAENVAILLTDGQSNIFPENTVPNANRLKATGTKVIAIGIGLTNFDEISQIASGPKDVFKVQGFDVLGDVKAEIIGSSCSAAVPQVEVARQEEIFEN